MLTIREPGLSQKVSTSGEGKANNCCGWSRRLAPIIAERLQWVLRVFSCVLCSAPWKLQECMHFWLNIKVF